MWPRRIYFTLSTHHTTISRRSQHRPMPLTLYVRCCTVSMHTSLTHAIHIQSQEEGKSVFLQHCRSRQHACDSLPYPVDCPALPLPLLLHGCPCLPQRWTFVPALTVTVGTPLLMLVRIFWGLHHCHGSGPCMVKVHGYVTTGGHFVPHK